MKLTGLGYKSELIFMNFDGDVEDRGLLRLEIVAYFLKRKTDLTARINKS